jgi:hypothetical protein
LLIIVKTGENELIIAKRGRGRRVRVICLQQGHPAGSILNALKQKERLAEGSDGLLIKIKSARYRSPVLTISALYISTSVNS